MACALAIVLAAPAAQARRAAHRASPLPTVSRPVVQPLPPRDAKTLDSALTRLAHDPRDVDALIDAGNAALVMGDVDAATGFFRRADQVSPGNPRVKAGLAGAMVRKGDPFSAIPLFDEAEKAGALDSALAGDRGLAYDLVGDNATAQRYYRQSLAGSPNDEVVRRLALSLAISGDRHEAELILSPLLERRDLAAWRTRAFALAILGETDEAVKIADTILPSDIAGGIAPYLRYMPRLTHAQQAAAANFGAFPRASEIGRDDPRVAQYAAHHPGVAAANAARAPQEKAAERPRRGRDRNRAARTEPQKELPALAAATPVPEPVGTSEAAPSRLTPPRPQPAHEAVAAPLAARSPAVAAAPGFSVARSSPMVPPAAPAARPEPVRPAPVRPAPPPEPPGLAAAFAEFARPSTDATPAAGAVDLRRIKPARPAPKKPVEPPKPPPPSHPSRIWVQLEVGRDKAALAYDWRRMIRENAKVFHGKTPSISDWGQTNRMLTGPFESEAEANAFIAQLRRADIDGAFVWTSPAGQVVDALPVAPARR